jgi:hypothetical protein
MSSGVAMSYSRKERD